MTAEHEAGAGAKCAEGPDGFCLTCGVEMTVCNVCHGIGYHLDSCTAFEAEIAAVATMMDGDTIARAVRRGKDGITADIAAGVVPAVRSFAELHNYVDANEYLDSTGLENSAEIQRQLDAWMRSGRREP
jgi:hypothetical protein